jgi:hypothetical protein
MRLEARYGLANHPSAISAPRAGLYALWWSCAILAAGAVLILAVLTAMLLLSWSTGAFY